MVIVGLLSFIGTQISARVDRIEQTAAKREDVVYMVDRMEKRLDVIDYKIDGRFNCLDEKIGEVNRYLRDKK